MHELTFLHQKQIACYFFLGWKKAVFVTYEIYFVRDKFPTNITPKSFTLEDEVTVHLSKCNLYSVRFFCVQVFVPVSNTLVLSEFN